MQAHHPTSPTKPATTVVPAPISFADLQVAQIACRLFVPPPQLLVDCGGLLVPHPLGVCRFVGQLLILCRRGTEIWLCNVHPGLRRCLQQLELGSLLHLNG